MNLSILKELMTMTLMIFKLLILKKFRKKKKDKNSKNTTLLVEKDFAITSMENH